MVTIQTTSGKERISKRRVRETLPSGLKREVRLKSYSEVKSRKGMFNEVLESICHGASGKGVGKVRGVSASTVCESWKARSKELLDEFHGRDLSEIDVVAMVVDGGGPGEENCVVGALAIDIEGNKHLLDFVKGKNLEAAESLESRKNRILALHRLNVSTTFTVTFLSTNHIENVMRNPRGMIGKVCN